MCSSLPKSVRRSEAVDTDRFPHDLDLCCRALCCSVRRGSTEEVTVSDREREQNLRPGFPRTAHVNPECRKPATSDPALKGRGGRVDP